MILWYGVAIVPVEESVHQETSVLLEVERVEAAGTCIVPACEIGGEDGDCRDYGEECRVEV